MSREEQGLEVLAIFIVGALARSIAGGLGLRHIASLFGLISALAIMYHGFWNLLTRDKKDKSSKFPQRGAGLLLIAIGSVFCLSLLMELLA